ncbi:glucose-6-phosphate isomerase [Roseivivax sp. CAU 1761]
MKKTLMILLATGTVALAGCQNLTPDQRFAAGGLAGGAAGLAVADRMDADRTGKIMGTLAGAAAGSTLAAGTARPQPRTVSCRYPNGQPAPCPGGYGY